MVLTESFVTDEEIVVSVVLLTRTLMVEVSFDPAVRCVNATYAALIVPVLGM